MINVNIVVWLVTGAMLGLLVVLENHFSMAALFVSFTAALISLTIFDLIRRQPIR